MFFVVTRRFTLRVKVQFVVTMFQPMTYYTFVNITRYNAKKNTLFQQRLASFTSILTTVPYGNVLTQTKQYDYQTQIFCQLTTVQNSDDNLRNVYFLICVIFSATHRTRLPDENITTMCAIQGIDAIFVFITLRRDVILALREIFQLLRTASAISFDT